MKNLTCDVLVVGAGPAGSAAARAAAESGANVVVVERRSKIGVPVQCAEYIPAPLLGWVDLEKDFITQSVRGMRTILPDGDVKETVAPGFTIRRDLFDQALGRAAASAGANIFLSTRALSLDDGDVVVKGKDGFRARIKATVIIGADGPRSRVGRWIGSVNRNLIPAVQIRVPLTSPLEYTEVYFDKDFYGGYGWLFPKGHEANVGVGRKKRTTGDEPIEKELGRFVSRLTAEGKIRKEATKTFAGWIPAEPMRKLTRDNILLVGDAGGQTHPITGAGIAQAVICGQMAGRTAASVAEKGDLSLLSEYEKEWQDFFGQTLERAHGRRTMLEKNWDQLESVIKICWVAFREYYA